MVRDALRGYLDLAGGLTEVTAARARAAARALVEQRDGTAGQISALAEDLVATSRRNRENVVLIVRHEVEQAARRLGFGAAADVDALMQRVRRLERTVRELQAQRSTGKQSPATQPASKKSTAKRSTAKTAAKNTANKAAKKTAKKATKRTTTRTARS